MMGTSPATLPDTEECYSAAQTMAVDTITSKDMVKGKTAWCIITQRGNLVWLRLLSSEPPDRPTLKFELMKWSKSS